MSYGVNVADLLWGAASYIDRILRGEKPNELAVLQPTRFELVVNARTARKLGRAGQICSPCRTIRS
jgi:putative ABC transport system substrate-binding protein